MRICRYWARASVDHHGEATADGEFVGVGWSEQSQADAEARALERARRIAERMRDRLGAVEDLREDYYADRPLREPIVDELHHEGRLVGAITRNIYGAFVLNAAEAMFVDIDRPRPSVVGFFARLMGKKPERVVDGVPERVAAVVGRHPGLGLRLYETAAGYRGLVTSRPCDPADGETKALLEAFDSDRLYVRLCEAQQCFRARLSPKPWRVGMPTPPRQYPWLDERRRQAFEKWSQRYEQASRSATVCRFVDTFGEEAVHPDVQPVLSLHDELACGEAERLA
ncbi:hypothetical protein ACERK3_08625 [Phycisphaerales bacterium AB-hyl4]|uniref:Uncharacterized protein n=1 Tax=Natronomicrosphaera hydrolytica TaxID=3242702 RepID=A0ABV4U777_9BACT